MLIRLVDANDPAIELLPPMEVGRCPQPNDIVAWRDDIRILDGPARFERRAFPSGFRWIITLPAVAITPNPKE